MKYLVCGNYGVGNVGDECIAQGIENLLKAKDSNAQVLRMGKGSVLPFVVRSFVKRSLLQILWRHPLVLIKKCDHFILGGGGLFTDEERPLTGFFWAMHGLVASYIMKKPVTVLGVSCGPMGFLSRIFTRLLFKSAQKVYCRDHASVDIAKALGACDVSLCPDMASYSEAATPSVDDSNNHDKKLLYFILRDYKNIDKIMITNFVQLIDHLYTRFGLKTVLIDFQNDSKNRSGIMNKIIAQNTVKNILSVQRIGDSIGSLSTVLRDAKFIFSMRYHGALLSLLNGTPFISINYMSKSSNFWHRFSAIKAVALASFAQGSFDVSQFDSTIESAHYRKSVQEHAAEYRKTADTFLSSFEL